MRLLSLQRGVENSKLFSNDARLLYTCRSFRREFRFGFIFFKKSLFLVGLQLAPVIRASHRVYTKINIGFTGRRHA